MALLAQDYESEARERLTNVDGWDEMCAMEDCSRFPVGYSTYAIGPKLYYFPTYNTLGERPVAFSGTVRPSRFAEIDENDQVMRSFGYASSLITTRCCHYLLAFYDLADDFPDFRPDREGNQMPQARMIMRAHSYDHRDNRLSRHVETVDETPSDAPPSIHDVISPTQLSYNDDFWLLDILRSANGELSGGLLSKRPLLNGRHVYAGCGTSCSFHTVSLAEDGNNERAHVSMLRVDLSGERLILCSREEIEVGCNPAASVFEKIPLMLERMDDMFAAAQQYPDILE